MKASALLAGCQTLVHLSWVFLKVGFVFFGGGYLLIPILHRELVVALVALPATAEGGGQKGARGGMEYLLHPVSGGRSNAVFVSSPGWGPQ